VGRVYTAAFSGVSVSAAQDFFEIVAPATAIIQLHEVHITQDAAETSEQLPVSIIRVPATVTSGSGGSSATPRKMQTGDPAAAATVEVNNTTVATTSGTLETLDRLGDNVLNGWHWVWPPESRPTIAPSGTMVVRLGTAPGSALTMSGLVKFEEIG
jgi:hypothetical protein